MGTQQLTYAVTQARIDDFRRQSNNNRTEGQMSHHSRSRARRVIDWIKGLWSELDYTNRRVIELRTGVPQR